MITEQDVMPGRELLTVEECFNEHVFDEIKKLKTLKRNTTDKETKKILGDAIRGINEFNKDMYALIDIDYARSGEGDPEPLEKKLERKIETIETVLQACLLVFNDVKELLEAKEGGQA